MGDGESAKRAKLEVLHTVRCLGCGTASPGIPGGVTRRNEADAAEEVVLCGPDAHLEAFPLEGAHGCVREARLELDAPAGSVEARPRHGLARRQPFVEHAGGDLDQRAAKTRPTGRADREL